MNNEILTLAIRYKDPHDSSSKLIETTAQDTPVDFDLTSDDFRFAASVIEFGMLLKDSHYKGPQTLKDLILQAESALGQDRFGYRQEFVFNIRT